MDDEDELLEGETVEIDDEEESDVRDTEDGGAIVTLEDEEPPGKSDFYANLAEDLDEPTLNTLASDFLQLIERDQEARKKRDEQYEEGIRRTGLGDDAPGGAQFQGASKVVHPLLTEVCVDFSARAIKELFPPQGPVKDNIIGEITPDKIKKAKRKTALMNWQLTTQSMEFRAELEQLLTQVPLAGAQYMKVTWNESRNRPDFMFVAIDDIYLPFAATNFYSAERKTHSQYLTSQEYTKRVKSGMYRDVDLVSPAQEPERSSADVANDKIEGRRETSYNEDGLRTVYEVYCTADLPIDKKADGPAPYIISIDKSTRTVLAIYRNWEEDDASQEEQQWFVEFPFVPWRGAYPIGIVHMIGGLSAAATGALRALLDSAHIQNAPTMLKLKGKIGGQSLTLQPTQIEEIEGGLNVDDIRKLAMPVPFNPPSSTLFQLLGFLVDAGKGVVRTTLDDTADSNANAPVGTTLAKIEQGMVVFSAIHGRLHGAMERLLRILHRLNGLYLDDDNIEAEVGEELARRKDFDGPLDVVPVSDPNIFSEMQRFAQVQAVAQRAAAMPQLYNARKVEERILATLKIPNAKELLAPALEPKEQNAVNENVAAVMGRPIVAFPEQDHIAHLKTHIAFMVSPALGQSRLMAPTFMPGIINHLKEHVALWYAAETFEQANEAAGTDIGEAVKQNKDAKTRQAFDRMLAAASQIVAEQAGQVFETLPPVIEQAIQLVQQMQPQGPQDPAQAAAMAEVQRKQAADQAKAQVDNQRLQIEQTRIVNESQTEAQRLEIERQRLAQEAQADQMDEQGETARTQEEIASREKMNTQDNITAMQLAQLEVASGERFAVSTGTGINPSP